MLPHAHNLIKKKYTINPYISDHKNPLYMIKTSSLERYRTRANYEEYFKEMVLKGDRIANMARAFYAFVIQIWIMKNRSEFPADCIDRILYFMNQTLYFSTCAVDTIARNHFVPSELERHAVNLELLPGAGRISAKSLVFNCILQEIILPIVNAPESLI